MPEGTTRETPDFGEGYVAVICYALELEEREREKIHVRAAGASWSR